MTRTSIVTFLLGALITVGVYETTGARITHERTSHAPSAPQAPTSGRPSRSGEVVLSQSRVPPASPARTGEMVRLSEEAIAQRTRADFAEGQLEAVEGHEIPWPHDPAPEYKEDAVARQLQEFVVDRGLAKIKSVDCSEYPCVETLQLPNTSPQAMQKVHEALNELIKHYYSGPVALSISSSRSGEGADAFGTASVSVMPNDEDVKARVRHRSDAALH